MEKINKDVFLNTIIDLDKEVLFEMFYDNVFKQNLILEFMYNKHVEKNIKEEIISDIDEFFDNISNKRIFHTKLLNNINEVGLPENDYVDLKIINYCSTKNTEEVKELIIDEIESVFDYRDDIYSDIYVEIQKNDYLNYFNSVYLLKTLLSNDSIYENKKDLLNKIDNIKQMIENNYSNYDGELDYFYYLLMDILEEKEFNILSDDFDKDIFTLFIFILFTIFTTEDTSLSNIEKNISDLIYNGFEIFLVDSLFNVEYDEYIDKQNTNIINDYFSELLLKNNNKYLIFKY